MHWRGTLYFPKGLVSYHYSPKGLGSYQEHSFGKRSFTLVGMKSAHSTVPRNVDWAETEIKFRTCKFLVFLVTCTFKRNARKLELSNETFIRALHLRCAYLENKTISASNLQLDGSFNGLNVILSCKFFILILRANSSN